MKPDRSGRRLAALGLSGSLAGGGLIGWYFTENDSHAYTLAVECSSPAMAGDEDCRGVDTSLEHLDRLGISRTIANASLILVATGGLGGLAASGLIIEGIADRRKKYQ